MNDTGVWTTNVVGGSAWPIGNLIRSLSPRTGLVRRGLTDNNPWKPDPNPLAGIRELSWFERNLPGLQQYAGLWIAIVGEEVLANGGSFEEVYDKVRARNLADALIVPVPENVAEERYLIA
jgi:hypothetical protein